MVKSIKLLLKELSSVFRFFLKTPETIKSIVIYSEHESYYSYFEGIIDELTNNHSLSLCYITSDAGDPVFQTKNRRIKPFYLNKLRPFFSIVVNCRVFIMTLTELNQIDLKRSVAVVHYVYMFHSLISTHMGYEHGAFDHYDSILCAGPYQIKEIRKHEELENTKPKLLVKAGYYRLERIYNAYKEYVRNNSAQSSKKTVLIAPSWGDENILESCGKRLIEILLNAEFDVIVRPHPETVRRSPELIESFRDNFGDNQHLTLELSVSTDDSLLRSDILISDFSGITLEYAFGTERPVLFLDVPAKIRNERYREIGIEPFELSVRSEIGIILSPDKLDTIIQVINNMIHEKESYKTRIIELRKKKIYSFGNSSGISAQFVADLVNDKDAGKSYNTAAVDSE